MKKLENKPVFITGGLSGIGKACAIAAVRKGANVAVADLHTDDKDAVMQEIQKIHNIAGEFIFLASDNSSFVTGTSLAIDGGFLAQ